ncbi:PadR family transcriptional regulator [bacterium]|nr:PadR family transcriptional regulator [bacterium]
MNQRKVSNPLGLAVMAVLQVEESHPYQIASTLRTWHKENSIKINYGSLYTIITSLEKAGFIEAKDVERDGARPERTIYGLTDSGQQELVEWMQELLSVSNKEYPLFGSALSLIAMIPPDEAAELLRKRIENIENRINHTVLCLSDCEKQGLERLFTIETEYEVALLEAEKSWVEKLIPLIEESEEFTSTWRKLHTGELDRVPLPDEQGEH